MVFTWKARANYNATLVASSFWVFRGKLWSSCMLLNLWNVLWTQTRRSTCLWKRKKNLKATKPLRRVLAVMKQILSWNFQREQWKNWKMKKSFREWLMRAFSNDYVLSGGLTLHCYCQYFSAFFLLFFFLKNDFGIQEKNLQID